MLPCLQWCEESGHGDPQRLRHAEKAEHRDVALAVFNLANVRRIQARSGGEGWLGESRLLPIVTEGCPQELEQRGRIAGLGGRCDGRGRLPRSSGVARSSRGERRTSSVGIQPGQQAGRRYLQGPRKTEQC
jgi:hypothetical protein